MQRILLLFLLFLAAGSADAQQHNYIRYNIANGLPSNTVYDVTQDKDGFIWIATDVGLVRFDGREMITYTMNDGLPGNDILRLYPDSKGRTWITSIHNSVCYHYKGKIYSFRNDSLLKKIRLNNYPLLIQENDQKDVLIGTVTGGYGNGLYLLTNENELITTRLPQIKYDHLEAYKGTGKSKFNIGSFDTISKTIQFYSYEEHWKHYITIHYNNTHDTLTFFKSEKGRLEKIHTELHVPNNKTYQFNPSTATAVWSETPPIPERISGPGDDGWSTFYYGTADGTFMLDSNGRISEHLLPGVVTNRAFIDRENNTWICTNAEGLVLIPSRNVKSLPVKNKEGFLFTLHKSGNTIFAGSTFSNLLRIQNNKIVYLNFEHYIWQSNNKTQDNRLRAIKSLDNKELILCYDDFILKYDPQSRKELFSRIDVTKGLFKVNDDSLCVFTGRAAVLLNGKTLAVLDTILLQRCYSGVKSGAAWYIGTASGPVKIVARQNPVYLGNSNSELNTLINHMEPDQDGSIWMSSIGNGLFRIRNDQVIQHFNTNNGLNSNNCKSLTMDEKFVWVGTEKGLNRIDRHFPQATIQQYSTEDGLVSNDIYSILSDSGKIYLGTEGYLTWFDTSRIKELSDCQLQLLSVEQGKQQLNADSLKQLSYNENNLKFTFTAISFRSSNNILYLYKLKGLSVTWDSTRNNNLEFLALPPGEYQLEIFARNKFGQNSNTISVPFAISPPFWATWWFRLLIISMVLAIVWWIILRRLRSEKEKANTQNRINELEQQALRSQMNPHFIFNCLNSIQNFLLQNNFEKTNEYLTAFAHLIRQTLDNSSRTTISIEGEMKYLSSYLELECMRFAYSFKYSIEVDQDIDTEYTHIPTMILQPYVENSIRHGIRYRQEGEKSVRVSFLKRGNTLVCIVEDSGVGRKKSSELKSFMHLEYQSKGMRLTAERIEALNRRQEIPITVDVIDLEEAGNATGTQVIVRFPNMFL